MKNISPEEEEYNEEKRKEAKKLNSDLDEDIELGEN